jgi:hypothetical protein
LPSGGLPRPPNYTLAIRREVARIDIQRQLRRIALTCTVVPTAPACPILCIVAAWLFVSVPIVVALRAVVRLATTVARLVVGLARTVTRLVISLTSTVARLLVGLATTVARLLVRLTTAVTRLLVGLATTVARLVVSLALGVLPVVSVGAILGLASPLVVRASGARGIGPALGRVWVLPSRPIVGISGLVLTRRLVR